MKKLLSILLVFALCISLCAMLAGCGKNSMAQVYYLNFKPESAKVYEKIAAEYEAQTGVKVKVVGFADKVGSDEYNIKLSTKRAEAVAEILRANGVEVEVVAGGESEEYKERFLNRRAVITVAE